MKTNVKPGGNEGGGGNGGKGNSGPIGALFLLAAALALATSPIPIRAAQINENEAVAIAEWWYANELNAPTTLLNPSEKATRLAHRTGHQIHTVIGRDKLQTKGQTKGPLNSPVSAYIVTFEPSGFVLVSGEDSVNPVLAFNITAPFQWSSPEKSYLTHFAGRAVVGAVQRARSGRGPGPGQGQGQGSQVHTNWARLRARLNANAASAPGLEAPAQGGLGAAPAPPKGASIYVLLPTALWNQGMFYNNTCVAHCGGQSVPTGCTATAMAIKFRYHQWPLWGNGSHSYSDSVGGMTYNHSVSFSARSYNWSAMPTNNLSAPSTEVADLMYDCGVSVNMDYEPDGSGAWPSVNVFNGNFRYRGTIENSSGTPSDHIAAMAYSIRCGLPTVMCSSTHCVVACGYRDGVSPYFYLNGGHGNSDDGWYDLDQLAWDDKTIDRSYPYSSPNHHAYVDSGHSGSETGDLQTPYQTVAAGQMGVPSGGILLLKGGHYVGPGNGAITLNKTMTVTNYLGAVIIGL
jgi:hypothetical protein